MNPAYARQLFRSCTASLSYRASVARPPRHVLRPCSPRYFSDDKSQASADQKPDSGAATQENGAQQPEKSHAQGETTEVTPPADVLDKLKAKEAEVTDLTSRLRYLQADFINLQRNAAREKEQQRDYAITRFAGDLLGVVDVLSLALKSIPKSHVSPASSSEPSASHPPDSSSPPPKSAQEYLVELHQGVDMTHRLLLSTLATYGVKPFDPTGEKFDPNRHEALYQAPIPGKEPGSVLECQKTGYTIKDRLLRAAQVGVVQDTS
ncbi:hypothetical protein ID866_5216 [Astraeus odoratus]|nr:hypothetical protein ID866_5216 [Astraeus odoratus]